MNALTLQPRTRASGEIHLPGSKSLSLRALLLASIASGNTRITNLLRSDDTERMLDALQALGIQIDFSSEPTDLVVNGLGDLFTENQKTQLFLGNSGASIRPLCAMLALSSGDYLLTGDEQMLERPIEHLVDGLLQLGADITYVDKQGYPPLMIKGLQLKGGPVSIQGHISSQFLTSLLMALPLADGQSRIDIIGDQVSKPYLDITLDIMRKFGVTASHSNYHTFELAGNQKYRTPGRYMVEGDASSASYFLAAAAIKGGPVRVHGIGRNSIQGDVRFVDALELMGAQVTRSSEWIEVSAGRLRGVDLDLNHIPDAAMTLATTALFAEGSTKIRNIYNWRVKETDRMHAMSTELRKLGAIIETGEDYIHITPPKQFRPAEIETYNDHRVAMSFSLAAFDGVPITIKNPECTAKTFPDYFKMFDDLTL